MSAGSSTLIEEYYPESGQWHIRGGRRVVIATKNSDGYYWHSRLYVNNGGTATTTHASHATRAGTLRWAAKVLA